MKSERLIQELTDEDLYSHLKINDVIEQRVDQKMRRSQRGLFHGKGMGRKIQTCFSEKKSVKLQRPNIMKKYYFSNILQKKFRLSVTTTAMRKMRRLGGFDNYILCTSPKSLDSIYGEYLRRLMLNKVKDPEYRIPYIIKTSRQDVIKQKKKVFKRIPATIHPKEQRHTDMSMHKFKEISELNRQEYKDFLILDKQFDDLEDTDVHNPVIIKAQAELEDQYEKIKPMMEEVTREYEEGYLKKRTKLKSTLREYLTNALEEINSPNSKLTPLKKEKKTKTHNVKRKKELSKSKLAQQENKKKNKK